MPPWPWGGGMVGSVSQILCCGYEISPLKDEQYQLEAVFNGYATVPFATYSWTTQRMERPIVLHPKFNKLIDGTKVMYEGKHWWPDPFTGQFSTFPPFEVKGAAPSQTRPAIELNKAVPNRYRGVESFVVSTGIWRRTTYTLTPSISGKLWKIDAPKWDADFALPGSLTSSLPDPANSGSTNPDGFPTWLKSQEDCENSYAGASQLWAVHESWWHYSLGWIPEVYV